tara:strand:- start:1908 stop:3779 length:1872 start_codon:yes stop_codon:yes gene_type:complete
MAIKSSRSFGVDTAQTLYDTIRGVESNWLLFVGGITENPENVDSVNQDISLWEEANFFQKIRGNDVRIMTRKVEWQRGQIYYPYLSEGLPTGVSGAERNYYAINDSDEVFICLGANSDNRYDKFGLSSSTVKPSRSRDDQLLEDGYRWKFLYKLDLSEFKFVTRDLMPIPDVREYDNISSSSTNKEEAFRRGCGPNTGASGSVCFYYNEPSVDPVSGVAYQRGDFDFCTDRIDCSKGFDIAKRLNRSYTFTRGGLCGNCLSQKTFKLGYELALEDAKNLNPNSNSFLQANVYKESIENSGRLLSLFVDLTGLDENDLKVSVENPPITISSLSGAGASARFLTFKKGQDNIIYGVELLSRGKGYRDVVFNNVTNNLSSRLKVSIDYNDGVFANPRRILNGNRVMIKVNVRTDKIANTFGTDQTTFNRYGIIRDVKVAGQNSEYIAGTLQNTDEIATFSNVTKITVKPKVGSFSFASGAETLTSGSLLADKSIIEKEASTNDQLKQEFSGKGSQLVSNQLSQFGADNTFRPFGGLKVVNYKQNSSTAANADIEVITGKDTLNLARGDKLAVGSDTTNEFEIDNVTQTRSLVPYSGSIVSSNQTSITTSSDAQEATFQFIYTLGKY